MACAILQNYMNSQCSRSVKAHENFWNGFMLLTLPQMPSAEEYRRNAAECREISKRMSLRDDRERMAEMAQRWLELAEKAEEQERARD